LLPKRINWNLSLSWRRSRPRPPRLRGGWQIANFRKFDWGSSCICRFLLPPASLALSHPPHKCGGQGFGAPSKRSDKLKFESLCRLKALRFGQCHFVQQNVIPTKRSAWRNPFSILRKADSSTRYRSLRMTRASWHYRELQQAVTAGHRTVPCPTPLCFGAIFNIASNEDKSCPDKKSQHSRIH